MAIFIRPRFLPDRTTLFYPNTMTYDLNQIRLIRGVLLLDHKTDHLTFTLSLSHPCLLSDLDFFPIGPLYSIRLPQIHPIHGGISQLPGPTILHFYQLPFTLSLFLYVFRVPAWRSSVPA